MEININQCPNHVSKLIKQYLEEEDEESIKYYLDFLSNWLYIADEIIFKNQYKKEKEFFNDSSLFLDVRRRNIHKKLIKAFETVHVNKTSFVIVATIFSDFIGHNQFSHVSIDRIWSPILDSIVELRKDFHNRFNELSFIAVEDRIIDSTSTIIKKHSFNYTKLSKQITAEPRIFAKYMFPRYFHQKLQKFFKENIVETGLIFKLHSLYTIESRTSAITKFISTEYSSFPNTIDFVNFSYINHSAKNSKPVMHDNAIVYDVVYNSFYYDNRTFDKRFYIDGLNKRVSNSLIEFLQQLSNADLSSSFCNIDDIAQFFKKIMHKSQLFLLINSSAYQETLASEKILDFFAIGDETIRSLIKNNNDLFAEYIEYTVRNIPPNYFYMYWHNVFITTSLTDAINQYRKYNVSYDSETFSINYHRFIIKNYIHDFKELLNIVKKIDLELYTLSKNRLMDWHVGLSELFINDSILLDIVENELIIPNGEYVVVSMITLNNAIPLILKEQK